VRIGIVSAALLALLFTGPQARPADTATLSPQVVAVVPHKNKLQITVDLEHLHVKNPQGKLSAELLGPDGRPLARTTVSAVKDRPAHFRFDLPAPRLAADRLQLVCRWQGRRLAVPVQRVLLARAHETALAVSPELFAGSRAALRCQVHAVRSLTETLPLDGARVAVSLRSIDSRKVIPLGNGRTKKDGSAQVRFRVPEIPAGPYVLQVATRSALGGEQLDHKVRVKSEARILLVTDKPLYQPGQAMHLRALALRPFDLKPVAGAPLVFEVEDAKGNKVFKRAHKTSAYGIAHDDFQLADEVNEGAYQIRAILGQQQAQKTVTVKPYVLPKFKVQVSSDKRFYLPKETVKAEVQTDYFFGKPVAGGKIKVTASTFDVKFKAFQTWEGKTDAGGHAKFEIQLPDYFVGQPLQKGDALVRLEVKVTDTADHTETINRSWTVSDQPIRVSLIPEGGRLVPDMENRVFAAAYYPDGTPAVCSVKLWAGKEAKGKPLAEVKTNAAGLAEFSFTPRGDLFRDAPSGARGTEDDNEGGDDSGRAMPPRPVPDDTDDDNENPVMITEPGLEERMLFDMCAEARDPRGQVARVSAEVNGGSYSHNLLLRLDRAIYRGGDRLQIDVRTSAALPVVYLDVIKSGQVLLTRWLDVKDGKAESQLDLPQEVFGTLEVHAYQLLRSGAIVRDSRVVYVQPRKDLKIAVQTDKSVHLPGENGRIHFQVTDAQGKPAVAALGVIIVDEAVYALQEMQPGLEKVYFTLQEELLKPRVQMNFKPNEGVGDLVRQPVVPADKQQIARVLLTGVRPQPPALWQEHPVLKRQQQLESMVLNIGSQLYRYASAHHPFQQYDRKARAWQFRPALFQEMIKEYELAEEELTDPLGGRVTLQRLARMEKDFTAERLARAVNLERLDALTRAFLRYTTARRKRLLKGGKWTFPATILADAVQWHREGPEWLTDVWGTPYRLVKLDKKQDHLTSYSQLDYYLLVSAGPDRKFGTKDDVKWVNIDSDTRTKLATWWIKDEPRFMSPPWAGMIDRDEGVMKADKADENGGGGGDPTPRARARRTAMRRAQTRRIPAPERRKGGGGSDAGPAPRVREYFPETLKWDPAVITDSKGRATVALTYADSITTWRLSASASSQGGALGGVSAPLRVFQDFFVDLDLPVRLTQNDQITFPVAVYNYLKTPQTVTLELQKEPWFELLDRDGPTRSLDLKPNEVTSVKFRIKATGIGHQPLLIKARGSKLSDAIKRTIEVVPDGKRIERAVTDRLAGTVTRTITFPEYALPDASRLLVKIYPGVISQVLEGAEGMLSLPHGCMEQTSSSAYPNILVVDYLKKARVASPQVMLRAQQYLNLGYQRLLTFERPGGGFDWYGSGPPVVWLSALGLHEFSDMARVYPIDRGVIARTQKWLLKQQHEDGTWSDKRDEQDAAFSVRGSPKLLLTSYVAWALLESGQTGPEIKKAVSYIQGHLKDAGDNAYILALAANALAAWDAKDGGTLALLKKLDQMRKAVPEWQAACFPSRGQSLTYARGDSLTVETTALTVLAMVRTGRFTNSVNQALVYLVKSRGGHGTWGTTSATILSLKALLAGLGGARPKGKVDFTILVNGKAAARGAVTEENCDVLQAFDLKAHTRAGKNEVQIKVSGDTPMMYQLVGRHYEAWERHPPSKKQIMDIAVTYDRTKLSTRDLLKAKATLRYHGQLPTYNVIVDLGIAPGFTVDAGAFAALVKAKRIQRFSVTARQVTLYLGDVKPGDVRTFAYTLKPRYPIRARTPATVAYEYYTPKNRATARPVVLQVTDKK
jgi:hypothetical protein